MPHIITFRIQTQTNIYNLSQQLHPSLHNEFKMVSMACALGLTALGSFKTSTEPGNVKGSQTNPKYIIPNYVFQSSPSAKYCSVIAKAAQSNRNTKPNSVICADCDGNGAVLCSQCKGSGVNSVDLFNGQFKAGESCWLCGGKKEMLCGNCNGAGFVGGFLSTYDQ